MSENGTTENHRRDAGATPAGATPAGAARQEIPRWARELPGIKVGRYDYRRAIPRWARELPEAEDTWRRINELLYDGWQPAAVRRELNIPDSKKSSLELYANKYRYRRVLAPVSRLREELARGTAALAPDTVKLLRMVVEQSLSPGAELDKINRSAELLGKFMHLVENMGRSAEEQEAKREHAESGQTAAVDPGDALRRMCELYGIKLGN